MTQQSGSQFEEDLTVGIDEDEAFATDSIDLLGIGGDESSPIARLKTIILSIDWEINDDILQQLDDELHDLGEIWAGDKIKQVYVQGLSKIGRYIYKEKAGAHPNSIKLLITFYHNLEKIVTNEDTMGEDEKKQLLLADVKKFDQLKSQIGKPSPQSSSQEPAIAVSKKVTVISEYTEESDDSSELKTLKALVLGIDWEINDREMQHLGSEVKRLEGVFSQNKAKLILLQGIGALSSYINKKRSQSNSGVFSLLHSFYASLEKINSTELSATEEKQLLLSEVSKFNDFKIEISKDTSNAASVGSDAGTEIDHGEDADTPVAALSDSPASFSYEDTANEPEFGEEDAEVEEDVNSRLSSVFGDEGEASEENSFIDSDVNDALAGVNVETDADDDSDEEALPYEDGTVAPALADVDEDSSFSVEKIAEDLSVAPATIKTEAIVGDDIEEEDEFSLEDVGEPEAEEPEVAVGSEDILQGVEVETEADDDTDEESLPMEEGELVPALSDAEDNSGFNADNVAAEFDKSDSEAIETRLGSFFDDDVATSSEGWVTETSEQSLDADTVDTDVDDKVIPALSDTDEDNVVAALSEADEDNVVAALSETDESDKSDTEEIESRLGSFFDDDVATSSEGGATETEIDKSDTEEIESRLGSFFDDDVATSSEVKTTETEIDKSDTEEIESRLGSFFDDDVATSSEVKTIETEIDKSDSEEIESRLGSFFDDDIATSSEGVATETEIDESDSDEIESRLGSFFDEEVATSSEGWVTETTDQSLDAYPVDNDVDDKVIPALSDADEEDTANSEEIESRLGSFFDDTDEGGEDVETAEPLIQEEALAFFDDDTVIEETAEEVTFTVDDEIAFEVDSDDVADDDEIEFTVPGDTVTPLAAVLAGADADVEESVLVEDEAVIFEAVADDVELDLLPGEEYEDSLTDDEDIVELTPEVDNIDSEEDIVELTPEEDDIDSDEDIVEFTSEEDSTDTDDDLVEFLLVEDSTDTRRYESLAILVAAGQGNVEEDLNHDIFTEINRLRSDKNTSFSEKNFLQLLSTVSQYIEQNRDNSHALGLMQEIVSGLEMSVSSESSTDAVQEKLFSCTSQILMLQVKEKSVHAPEREMMTANEEDGESTGSRSYQAMGKDEQLASFVQKELSDIRKLFVEEIGYLRKELSEKK